jgi:hypothetical protein
VQKLNYLTSHCVKCTNHLHRKQFGTLPESIGKWTDLSSFSVVGNALTGTLPHSIGLWTALTSFDVFDNSFNGTLPDSIGEWTAMKYFDV